MPPRGEKAKLPSNKKMKIHTGYMRISKEWCSIIAIFAIFIFLQVPLMIYLVYKNETYTVLIDLNLQLNMLREKLI